MLTLELLKKMLLAAAVALKENVIPLCELDSVAGDGCLLYTSPSPRDRELSRMPSSA